MLTIWLFNIIALFENCATFLEYSVRQSVGSSHLEHYLDDYLGVANSYECEVIIKAFHIQCIVLGVPLADEKCLGPVTKLVI